MIWLSIRLEHIMKVVKKIKIFSIITFLVCVVIGCFLFYNYKTHNMDSYKDCSLLNGIKCKLPSQKSNICAAALNEKKTAYQYLSNAIKKGDTIINITGHTSGELLIIAKLVGIPGKIHYFNPFSNAEDEVHKALKVNLVQDSVISHNLALDSYAHTGVCVCKADNSDVKIEKTPYTLQEGYKICDVKISSVDHELAQKQNINMMIIEQCNNTENVLLGAKEIIKKSPNMQIVVFVKEVNTDLINAISCLSSNFGLNYYKIAADGRLTKVGIEAIKQDKSLHELVIKK